MNTRKYLLPFRVTEKIGIDSTELIREDKIIPELGKNEHLFI